MVDFSEAENLFRQAAEEGRDFLDFDAAQRCVAAGYPDREHRKHIGRWRRILNCENCVGTSEQRQQLDKQLQNATKRLEQERPKLEAAIREAEQQLKQLETPVAMLAKRKQAIEDHKAQLRAHVPPAIRDKHNRMKRIIKGSLAEELNDKRTEVGELKAMLVPVPSRDLEKSQYFERLKRHNPELVVSKTDENRRLGYSHSEKWPAFRAALEADLPAMEQEVEQLEAELDQALQECDQLLDWHLERLG